MSAVASEDGISEWGATSAAQEEYTREYWAVDAEVYARCVELAPEWEGTAVPLNALDELCRRMQRPLRGDNERFRLMNELDPNSDMRISRDAFTAWLLQDLYQERQQELQRERDRQQAERRAMGTAVPVATPTWEECETESAVDSMGLPVAATRYYRNVWTNETVWELPRFVSALWDRLMRDDEVRALKAREPREMDTSPATEMVTDLRALFERFDDDHSHRLSASEFQDLCVAIEYPLLSGADASGSVSSSSTGASDLEARRQNALLVLMQEVDPFSGTAMGQAVSWDALMHYWVSNAPFQRRTTLAAPLTQWQRIEKLDERDAAPVYQHVTTQAERWSHPGMEARIVELLRLLFPSNKLDWPQRVQMLLELDVRGKTTAPETAGVTRCDDGWTVGHCRTMLSQLGHECARGSHLRATLAAIRQQYGGDGHAGGLHDTSDTAGLDEATVKRWLLAAVERVEMKGWQELTDVDTQQVYYYHEVEGVTQWDPPYLQTQMDKLLARFGSTNPGSGTGEETSLDDKIQRIFRHYDTDESGTIEFAEFQRLYVALLGRKEGVVANSDSFTDDTGRVRQLFNVLDTSGDGEVSLDEFQLWWKTKMQLETDDSEAAKQEQVAAQRHSLVLDFLRTHDALIEPCGHSEAGNDQGSTYCFETNVLPRLVALLGKYTLKGLAYRRALHDLVATPSVPAASSSANEYAHLITLSKFLSWYDIFERQEREKEEEAVARARAAALLQTRDAEAKEQARRLKMRRKGQLITKVIATDESMATTTVGAGSPTLASQQRNSAAVWRRHLETLFRQFDRDGSGMLDAHELMQLTAALGNALDERQVQQMIATMATSSSDVAAATVNLDDFLAFWTTFQRSSGVKEGKSGARKKPHSESVDTVTRREGITMGDNHAASLAETTAAWAVGMELAKDRALAVSMDDVRGVLGDWRDSLASHVPGHRHHKSKTKVNDEQEQALARLQRLQILQQQLQFEEQDEIPRGTRRYAHLNVSHIEPSVVSCVVDMVATIVKNIWVARQPAPLRADAAQRIQRLMRGIVTRHHVLAMITARFQTHVDLHTSFFYYVDTKPPTTASQRPQIFLDRPLYRSLTSAAWPWELTDCQNKQERYAFHKKQIEMQRKAKFLVHIHAVRSPQPQTSTTSTSSSMYVPACFLFYDILESVRFQMASSLWEALYTRNLTLVQLIARRHPRQLQQRSSAHDASAPLPLHHVVRHAQVFPFEVIRELALGFPEAVDAVDGYGRTPLHLALRERTTGLKVITLLVTLATSTRTQRMRGEGKIIPTIWQRQTVTGETPLHLAVHYRVPIESLRLLLAPQSSVHTNGGGKEPEIPIPIDACELRNQHGRGVLHEAISKFSANEPAYWRSVLLAIERATVMAPQSWPRDRVYAFPTKDGDMPLHLAVVRYAQVLTELRSQEAASAFIHEPWTWLLQHLKTQYEPALLHRRPHDELLPIHLLLKAPRIPPSVVLAIFEQTVAYAQRLGFVLRTHEDSCASTVIAPVNQERDDPLMLPGTHTTLLHYALLHRARDEALVLELLRVLPSRYCSMAMQPTGNLPLHLAAHYGASTHVLQRIVELHPGAFHVTNSKHMLALHLALTSDHDESVANTKFLLEYGGESESAARMAPVWCMDKERAGLRAMVMASNVARPRAAILLALLDHLPSPSPPSDAKAARSAITIPTGHVTPLYALSLRRWSNKADERLDTKSAVVKRLEARFEDIDDDGEEEAHFRALAKAQRRRAHHCPTPEWTIPNILRLMDLNPVDEAVHMRALLAINQKLQRLQQQEASLKEQHPGSGDHAILETITLNRDWMLVQRVHQVMYELPWNPRIQLLGRAVLTRLLPTAYARATYKTRVDPYFNL